MSAGASAPGPAAAPRAPERQPATSERIFYDGECGLCHRLVRFAAERDRGRALFRFAPLQGSTFEREVVADERRSLPDSLIVKTADGRLLARSAAALHVGRRIGGGWAVLARFAGVLPRALLDLGYDGIARVRRRLFPPPAGACPLLPPELARRFDP